MPDDNNIVLDFEEKDFVETEKNFDNGFGETGPTRDQMNLFFLLDTSGSMSGQRIASLNNAMPIALDAAEEAANQKEAELFVRIIQFNDYAEWVIGGVDKGVPVAEAKAQWKDLGLGTLTNTADAIELCLKCMHTRYLGTRSYHPVVILITDGGSNDSNATKAAVDKLKHALSGDDPNKVDKVWRFALGVVDYNEQELLDFATLGTIEDELGNEQVGVPMVFPIEDVSTLSKVLKTVTVSSLVSNTAGGNGGNDSPPVIPI